MIDEARARQEANALENMHWQIADVGRLPFEDEAFSVVLTRYSFRHLLDPQAAISEMLRVCKSGGTSRLRRVWPSASPPMSPHSTRIT